MLLAELSGVFELRCGALAVAVGVVAEERATAQRAVRGGASVAARVFA